MKINPTFPEKRLKMAVEICRAAVGLVFVFSGFVKAVDPWGSAYKMGDYLAAWGFTSLDFLALPASFALSTVEFVLGVGLLAGVYRRVMAGGVFVFMCLMTPLTLYLAIFDPVSDCGCFGDAVVITNWQTFYKNVVLIGAAWVVFRWHGRMTGFYGRGTRRWVVLWSSVCVLGVSVYGFRYLPVLDFRPYRTGNNILEQMQMPEGAVGDVYETTLIYEKGGERRRFTIDNYPSAEEGWVFVEAVTKVRKGYEPPVHDFTITAATGEDMTGDVLADPGYVFLLVAHKLERADDANISRINSVYDYALQRGYGFLCLTASLPGEIREWRESTGAEYPFCTMDDVPLKTMIRSNPGLLLLRGGTVVRKWPSRCIPDDDDWLGPLEDSPLGVPPVNRDGRKLVLLALGLVVPLVVIGVVGRNKC
jgi:uncharacterized membrane protein YphA (DoxX/SURF4 family)